MKLTKQKVPFTQVANEVLMNPKLSFRAKGLYAYLFSKPDGWEFSADRIQAESTENRKTVLADLKVLEQAGYLERKRKPTGKVEYTLKYQSQSPQDGLGEGVAQVRSTHGGENGLVSNKEVESNKEELAGASPAGVVEVIDAFEETNPSFKKWYGNKTQRSAITRMVETHGLDKVLKVVGVLPKVNGKKYFPTITTPLQLEDKWAALETAFVRYKGEEINKKAKVAFT